MKLIFGQSLDKIAFEFPIVFGYIGLHRCLVEGRDILGVISYFDSIYMKFGMKIEFDVLNNYPKFGFDQLISCPVRARTKNSAKIFPLSAR